MARVVVWADCQELTISQVVTEMGSTLSGRRQRFLALLQASEVQPIGVEH
jgi:predicted site-specific integrase-resolvase